MVVEELGLSGVEYAYTGGARGWRGDVPVVRFDSTRIRALGWRNARSSREAIQASIRANIAETADPA
jgi:UDP-glucose 4-epimerase